MEASLYVHVPFCVGQKCDYCDFYSLPVDSGDHRPARYIGALLAEAERIFEMYRPEYVPTLYLGGGTPSALGAAGIKRLLAGLLGLVARYSLLLPTEITVEANPESADEAFLASAREGGATRLSLGVQSFHAASRKAVNRVRDTANFTEDDGLLRGRLALAAEYFPSAFSADLLSGLPYQNERVLLDDIAALLSYKPAHVSLYALTIAEGTPLARKINGSRLPQGDEADRLWLCGRDSLEKNGYAQYEVSNFCLPGKESLHNIRYWRMKNWLGLGPSASGTIIRGNTGQRFTYPPSVDDWDGKMPGGVGFLTEELDPLTLVKETMLMGFRHINGPDEKLFLDRFGSRHGGGIEGIIPKTIGAWRERGLLREDRAALTKEGLLFLNAFLLDAFQEMDCYPDLQSLFVSSTN